MSAQHADGGHLFSPFKLRDVTLPNRIVTSPMCQYSAQAHDGCMTDWHLVHLGSRAVGGCALVMTEATAVMPEGRISPADLGLWNESQAESQKRVSSFIHAQGAASGVQLAHAGRKASTAAPWQGGGLLAPAAGGWTDIWAPSAIAFATTYATPRELDRGGIERIQDAFAAAARRALRIGHQVVEIHAAHGYLFHEFLSPLSNRRDDQYGGSFENRIRLLVETVDRVRNEWPDSLPLFVRISATDWLEFQQNDDRRGEQIGWTVAESVELAKQLRRHRVDLIDVSSGGNVTTVAVPAGPGYQVGFAERIRREAEIAVGAVGMIEAPAQADHIIRSEQADLVSLARQLLRDPYWPLRAARELGSAVPWPVQYSRAAQGNPPERRPFQCADT